jgi:hypothetical protein
MLFKGTVSALWRCSLTPPHRVNNLPSGRKTGLCTNNTVLNKETVSQVSMWFEDVLPPGPLTDVPVW